MTRARSAAITKPLAVILFLCLGMRALHAQNALVLAHVTVEHADSKSKAPGSNNAVVWLEPIKVEVPLPASKPFKYRLTQRDKQFQPHVMAVPVGAAVEFPNKDPFFHNVFSLYDGKRFDLGLYEAGRSRTVHFDRPGVSFIFCNIHPEMNAYVLALETPYFAVSDSKGEIRISDVVPGHYRLRAWFERAESTDLARLSRDVNVSGPEFNLGELTIRESAHLIPQHTDKHGNPYDTDRSPYP